MSVPRYLTGQTADGIDRDALDAGDVLDRPWDDYPTGHPVCEDFYCGVRCVGDVCGGERLCNVAGPEHVPTLWTCGVHTPSCQECYDASGCRECAAAKRRAES